MVEEEEKKKKIVDIHKELLENKVQLTGIDADEKILYEDNRKERMSKIEEVKDLYKKSKSILNELLEGNVHLKSIDFKDKAEYDKNKQKRQEKFQKLKENVEQTQNLMEEIQHAPELKKIDEQELQEYKIEKEKALEKLKSFSSILEEITSKDPKEILERIDLKELEEYDKGTKLRLKIFNEANFHLTQFGSILEEISSRKIKLSSINEKELKEHEKDRKQRLKGLGKIKTKMDIIISLVEEISKDIKPNLSEEMKTELLEKFEIADKYLKIISKNKTEKLEILTGLKDKISKVEELFIEMKNTTLTPISNYVKSEIEQEKIRKEKEIGDLHKKIQAKFEITNQLLKEIKETPSLEHISDEELQKYEAEKFQRRSRIQVLKNHLDVAEELLITVKEEIPLHKIDEQDLKEYQNLKNERLGKLSNVKNKLDVLEELMRNIGKGITLFKIDPKELEEHEREKQKRLQDIENLKQKLRDIDILRD